MLNDYTLDGIPLNGAQAAREGIRESACPFSSDPARGIWVTDRRDEIRVLTPGAPKGPDALSSRGTPLDGAVAARNSFDIDACPYPAGFLRERWLADFADELDAMANEWIVDF